MTARYQATKDESIRAEISRRMYPLVRSIAESIARKLPVNSVSDVDDLTQVGVIGLFTAIGNFDADRGLKLGTYAGRRIAGAIQDHLREIDFAPRLVRQRTRKLASTIDALTIELGREPQRPEIAERLGVSMHELSLIESDSKPTKMRSTEVVAFEGNLNSFTIGSIIPAPERPNTTDDRDQFNGMLVGLSRAERLIITLYYREEMTMREIGRTLELSESRVSQMHASILLRLKERLAPAL